MLHYEYPGDGCQGVWKPRDFGKFLERQAMWQVVFSRLGHNEIIIGSENYREYLPHAIDAFFYTGLRARPLAKAIHSKFRAQFPGVTEAEVPLIRFDPSNWDRPFSMDLPPA